MKIGTIVVTPKGLNELAKSIRTLGGNSATLEVHKDDDTHGVIRVCAVKESGWINLDRGLYE